MHRPEHWGYVQFSTGKPGAVAYQPDPAGPVRERLMQVYHGQAAFHGQNKRWTASLDDLKLPELAGLSSEPVILKTTPEGFTASLTFTPPGGSPQTWVVTQDSRLTRRDDAAR